MAISFFSVPVTLLTLIACVLAEKHTVSFDNQCGFGTPRLIKGPTILSNGESFTSDGPLTSAISYLQTGNCGFDGIGCSLVELTLINPTCPGCGSSADISLIPPLAFSVPVAFSYEGGCNGQGTTCTTADCNTAFFVPDDNHVQVACQDNDVNLKITFCPGGSGATVSTGQHAVVQTSTTEEAAAATTSATVHSSSNTEKAASSSAAASSSQVPVATSSPKVCNKKRSERFASRSAKIPRNHRMVMRSASQGH